MRDPFTAIVVGLLISANMFWQIWLMPQWFFVWWYLALLVAYGYLVVDLAIERDRLCAQVPQH